MQWLVIPWCWQRIMIKDAPREKIHCYQFKKTGSRKLEPVFEERGRFSYEGKCTDDRDAGSLNRGLGRDGERDPHGLVQTENGPGQAMWGEVRRGAGKNVSKDGTEWKGLCGMICHQRVFRYPLVQVSCHPIGGWAKRL